MAGAPARPADAEASQIEVYGHFPSLEDLACRRTEPVPKWELMAPNYCYPRSTGSVSQSR